MIRPIRDSIVWEEIFEHLKRNSTSWDTFRVPVTNGELLVTVTLVPPDPIAASIQTEQTSWD